MLAELNRKRLVKSESDTSSLTAGFKRSLPRREDRGSRLAWERLLRWVAAPTEGVSLAVGCGCPLRIVPSRSVSTSNSGQGDPFMQIAKVPYSRGRGDRAISHFGKGERKKSPLLNLGRRSVDGSLTTEHSSVIPVNAVSNSYPPIILRLGREVGRRGVSKFTVSVRRADRLY